MTLVVWIAITIKGIDNLLPYMDNTFSYETNPTLEYYAPYSKHYPKRAIIQDLNWFADHVQSTHGLYFFVDEEWDFTDADSIILCDAFMVDLGFYIPTKALSFASNISPNPLILNILFYEALTIASAMAWAANLPVPPCHLLVYTNSLDTVELFHSLRVKDRYNKLLLFVVPEFKGHKDPTKGDTWAEGDSMECKSIVAGYFCAYDKVYVELNNLLVSLKKEDVVAEKKQKAEEEQKKKEKEALVASGSGKGKGKAVEETVVIDLDSEVEGKFIETCLNCKKNKITCIFTHPTNSKKSA
ncbi:hypothetical protein M422DRAFT_259694 [Sphaerobolus stellatus SS14]|uniref:Unplaced genomic scaffold SPHSTscaffold_91, whole genome shotgun sequence n=1 Tax=Sphaerobolus stellatus (strain SS14) TaxID=990650 RepID=A0A0C9USM7_SPHS4|nr:hypothetical protein M422DRAFT_259694 [Sphaerobolus stellatus SS14]